MRSLFEDAPHFIGHTGKKPHEKRIKHQENIRGSWFWSFKVIGWHIFEDNGYPHDRRADKDSYPHDSNNQCIILRLQLSFAMFNVQLMLV